MNRRPFLPIVTACIALASAAQVTAEAKSSRRPNIVFILADDLGYGDLGYGDLGCYGQKKIKTIT